MRTSGDNAVEYAFLMETNGKQLCMYKPDSTGAKDKKLAFSKTTKNLFTP
jgi:hypothetical protein